MGKQSGSLSVRELWQRRAGTRVYVGKSRLSLQMGERSGTGHSLGRRVQMKGDRKMNELIRINENGKTTARELYEFLELNPSHFTRWFKINITDNQFAAEGTDYKVFATNGENPQGGRPGMDAELTIDLAKKLCMASNSERGEQARNYFIEVEKRLKAVSAGVAPRPIERKRRRSYMIKTAVNDIGATAKALTQVFGVRPEMALSVAYSTVTKNYEMDLSPLRSLVPAAKHNIGRLIPTDLGIRLGGIRAEEVNNALEALGLQIGTRDHKKRKKWGLTEKGKEFGECIPVTSGRNGHNDYQIQWSEKVLPLLEAAIKEEASK